MKEIAVIIGLMFLAIAVNAQEQNKKNTDFRVSCQVGAAVQVSGSEIERIDKTFCSINFRLVVSYFLIPQISVGAGLGLDKYQNLETSSYPILLDAKYYLFDSRNTPFVYGIAGKMIKVSDSSQKGSMLDAGIGYKFFAGENFCLNATIGCSFKNLKNIDIVEYNSNEISVGISILF